MPVLVRKWAVSSQGRQGDWGLKAPDTFSSKLSSWILQPYNSKGFISDIVLINDLIFMYFYLQVYSTEVLHYDQFMSQRVNVNYNLYNYGLEIYMGKETFIGLEKL